MKKRLGILLILPVNKTIEEYVFYLANEAKKVVNDLVIVCNGKVDEVSKKKLYMISNHIYERENEGYDCGAFKQTIEEFIGWKTIEKYDELMLLNDSCFGPLYSLSNVFQKMEEQNYDFWGITEQNVVKRNHYSNEYYPYHIQTYFLVICKTMLKSNEFKNFWQELKMSNIYEEVVENYELKFTKYFNDAGFRSGVYVDSSCFGQGDEENQAYVFYDSYKLIAEQHCPFLKKKVFLMPHDIVLSTSSGETARKTLQYVTNNTIYDENLIWDYLLNRCNVSDIRTALHLDYIIDENNIANDVQILSKRRVAIIAHISYWDLIDHCLQYINRIPDTVDVYITTKGDNNIKKISKWILENKKDNCKVIVPKDRGREISALLVACKDYLMKYDYLCFVHDKKKNSGVPYQTVGQSFMDILWNNSIKSAEYIENVIQVFEKEQRLGLLATPSPYMSYYFMVGSLSWTGSYGVTKTLADRLHLKCNMSPDKQPFVLGTTFWCRPCALKPLFGAGLEYEDFDEEPLKLDNTISHAIERIFPFVAQSEGFYSGIMMTKEYASLYSCNYQFMLNTIIQNVLLKQGIKQLTDVNEVNPQIYNFCMQHDKIYIYGAGAMGQSCLRMLEEHEVKIEAFLVSDGYRNKNKFVDKPILEVSEIEEDECGIIIALNERNYKEALVELSKIKCKDFISYAADN